MALVVTATSSVWPSAGARATVSVARLLAAPGRFSTMNGCPRRSDRYLAHQARQEIARSAGWKSGDDAHWLRWIGLRAGDVRPRQERATARGELQEFATLQRHSALRGSERLPIWLPAS